MVVGVQDVDGIKVVVQGFVTVSECWSDGQTQFSQNGLVPFKRFVILTSLGSNAIVAKTD